MTTLNDLAAQCEGAEAGNLSKREIAFLSALTDEPKTVAFWGSKVLAKFKGYRSDTEVKLWVREMIHVTEGNPRAFRITPEGRAALLRSLSAKEG